RAGWLRRDGRRRRDGGWLGRGRGERQQDQVDHRQRIGVRTAQFDFLRRVAGRADRQENRVVLVQLDRVEREPAGFVGSRLESGGVRRIVRRGIRERNLSIRQRDGEAVLDDAHVSDQRHAAEFFRILSGGFGRFFTCFLRLDRVFRLVGCGEGRRYTRLPSRFLSWLISRLDLSGRLFAGFFGRLSLVCRG